MPSAPSPPLWGRRTRRPGLPRRPLSRLARLPEAPDTTITLNGNAPRRPVLSPCPAWVGMEQATRSQETNKKWSRGPRRRGGSEASRAPQAAEERGHDARGLPSDLGSERKKRLRLGVSSTKLCSQLAKAQKAQESGGLGARGARGPAPPAWKAVAAPGQLRRAQTPRRPSFVAAALPAPHPPPARSALRGARSRRRRRPLPAGHAPAETRAVSWTAAPALPISAARPGRPAPRAAPDACERPRDTGRAGEGPGHPRDAGMHTSSVNEAWSRAPSPCPPLGVRPPVRRVIALRCFISSQKTNDRMPALPLKDFQMRLHAIGEDCNATETSGGEAATWKCLQDLALFCLSRQ